MFGCGRQATLGSMAMHQAVCGLLATVIVALVVSAEPLRGQSPVRWNAAEMGAVADGETDNTAAFQKALDAAGKAGGGVVEVPAGRYRVNGTLSVPAGVTLQGTYRVPPTAVQQEREAPDGTVLLAYAGRGSTEGPPFIRLAGSNSAIAGLVIVYPEWKQTDVPPVPYPPCVASHDTENVGDPRIAVFLIPTRPSSWSAPHRHLVRNVTGYPSQRGLFVDECYDIGHIENIHFWPFGVAYQPNDPYCKWVNTQGVAFELARTDWHYVSNTFCFGYGVGLQVLEVQGRQHQRQLPGPGGRLLPPRRAGRAGTAAGPADHQRRIRRAMEQHRFGVRRGRAEGRGQGQPGQLLVLGTDRPLRLDAQPVGQFTASACHFVHWDNHQQGSPAIQLDAGKAIVQACTFAQEGLDVQVGEQVRSAILTANQADGGFRADNRAGPRAQITANEVDPFETTPEARSHYRVQIGASGDGRFLKQWHGRERLGAGGTARPMRWSTARAKFVLPVVPGKAYQLTLELQVPKQAATPGAGLFLGDKSLAPIATDTSSLVVELPANSNDEIAVELRCQGWVPKDVIAGSKDDRSLGVAAFSLEMRTADAEKRTFDANRAAWLDAP